MKILVIAPSWIGDTVLAQPLFKRLHEKYPKLVLDVLAPPWVSAVLECMPEVSTIIDNPFGHGELKLFERIKFAKKLASQNYDQVIVLPNSWKSALIPFFAKIPLRAGFLGEMRYGLLNRIHKLDEKTLPRMVERFAQLAQAPGKELIQPIPHPKLICPENDIQQVLSSLEPVLLGYGATRLTQPTNLPKEVGKVAVFCPGAEYGPAKRWPAQYFAELARLLKKQGYQVCLIGSPNDQALGDEIENLSEKSCINLCGKTNLKQAMALISLADIAVTNDSGLMHIAAALDRKLIAIYGSSSPAFTPPLSQQARIVKIDIECSPCFKRECPLGHFKCMKNLLPSRILEEIFRLN